MAEFEALKQTDDIKEIKEKYRHLFLTPLGLEVLADILTRFCHFMIPVQNMDEVVEQRVGILIMGMLGVVTEGNEIEVVRALASVVPKPIKEE